MVQRLWEGQKAQKKVQNTVLGHPKTTENNRGRQDLHFDLLNRLISDFVF